MVATHRPKLKVRACPKVGWLGLRSRLRGLWGHHGQVQPTLCVCGRSQKDRTLAPCQLVRRQTLAGLGVVASVPVRCGPHRQRAYVVVPQEPSGLGCPAQEGLCLIAEDRTPTPRMARLFAHASGLRRNPCVLLGQASDSVAPRNLLTRRPSLNQSESQPNETNTP